MAKRERTTVLLYIYILQSNLYPAYISKVFYIFLFSELCKVKNSVQIPLKLCSNNGYSVNINFSIRTPNPKIINKMEQLF